MRERGKTNVCVCVCVCVWRGVIILYVSECSLQIWWLWMALVIANEYFVSN